MSAVSEPRRLTAGLVVALGFLAAVGPLATDAYLASFTDIAADLGVAPSQVQLTLTTFLIGIGAGQLLLGPLSDRWGRRPVLITTLAVFAAVSVGMAFSDTIEIFIALRLVQGLTGAAGIVIARAIAVDLSEGDTAVRALSLLAMVTAVGPLVAPPLGGVFGPLWGWRGVLGLLGALAVAMLLTAILVVPESLPREHRSAGRLAAVFAAFGPLLRDPVFVGYSLTGAFGFAAMMSYISASPFVGQQVLGMEPLIYSLAFVAGATALIGANLLNARIAPRVGPARMLRIGTTLSATGGAAMTVLTLTGALSPVTLICCALLVTGGAGLSIANASALALARTTRSTRGSGAALMGAIQFLFGAVASPLVGLWGEDTALPMALVVLTAGAAALLLGLLTTTASRRTP